MRISRKAIDSALTALAVGALVALGGGPAAAEERPLAFAVRGVVGEILVKPGQKVEAGAPLARLDTRPALSRREAAEVRLAAAHLRLDHADKNFTRIKQMFDDLQASAEEVEKAELKRAEARAETAEAKAHVDLLAWRIERAVLVAPAAGTVTAVPGYPGQPVNPAAGAAPVVVLDTR
jgi:RND family efflux transporter MFP subunit